MKKNNLILGIYLPIYILLATAAVTLKTIGVFYNLDRYGNYGGAVVVTVANLLVVFGAVFFLTYAFLANGNVRLVPSFSSPMNYIPSGLVSAALAFMGANLIVTSKECEFPINLVTLIAGILAFISIIYFLLATVYDKRISARRASFGIAFLLFLCLYVATIYYSKQLPINAPNKIADQMAYLFITVFFLYEIRLSLGREKWRLYVAFGFIAALIAAYSAIPALIIYFAERTVLSISIYESILTASLLVFILFKIILTVKLTEDKESEFVTALKTAANARESEINPSAPEEIPQEEAEPEQPDENQMSIIGMESEGESEDVDSENEIIKEQNS